MTKEQCENCKFAMPENKQYICRRNPPVAVAVFVDNDDAETKAVWPRKHVGTVAVYPPMQGHGWCGEYSPRLALTSAKAKI